MKRSIFLACAFAFVGMPSSRAAVITALDNFSSGNLSGGTNWQNSWSGGTVLNSALLGQNALFQTGNSPQEVRRKFVQQTDLLTPFTVSFDIAIIVDTFFDLTANPTGNYGFRAYMENQQPSVYSIVWQNDQYGGALTFFHGNNQVISVPDASWNITNLAELQGKTFNFRIDVTPTAGQNSGQYNGTQVVTFRRSDGLTYSSGPLSWNNAGSPRNASDFDELVFYNSSNRTTTQLTNVLVGNPSLIPEPSIGALLTLGSFSLLLFRRRRN